MTIRPSGDDSRKTSDRDLQPASRFALPAAALAPLLLAAVLGCRTAGPDVTPRDRFPLDPREGLAGPFSESIEVGVRALLDGEAESAAAAFGRARLERRSLAADIGLIEALILQDKADEAVRACTDVLPSGEATLPLLVACGEARARAAQPVAAWELYERAVGRDPGREGLRRRGDELKSAASEALVGEAREMAGHAKWKESRSRISRAIELAPESASARAVAGEIELSAGDESMALRHYREALELEPKDRALREKVGEIAHRVGDFGLAVSAFEELSREDASFRERAAEARLAFRISNWPETERKAARSKRLTRAGATALVWWMFPEVREAQVKSGVVATDVLERRDRRALTRMAALGLLEVNRDTHRLRPDAPLTRGTAARLLVRLINLLRPAGAASPGCLGPAAAPRVGIPKALDAAGRCGLLAPNAGAAVGGPEFTRALDRARALSAGAETPAPAPKAESSP
jgi:tetratricopeptide (TPR) repeat protein